MNIRVLINAMIDDLVIFYNRKYVYFDNKHDKIEPTRSHQVKLSIKILYEVNLKEHKRLTQETSRCNSLKYLEGLCVVGQNILIY